MDIYFRAIGISDIKDEKSFNKYIKEIDEKQDNKLTYNLENKEVFSEKYKSFNPDFGLVLYELKDKDEKTLIKECLPYAKGVSSIEAVRTEFEWRDRLCYCICEDELTGNQFVYRLVNIIDCKNIMENKNYEEGQLYLSGLSIYGSIILPVDKDGEYEELKQEEAEYYKNLTSLSRNGDAEAEEELGEKADEITDVIRERLKTEDFLSVVEGFFLPNDEDDTNYSILGDIVAVDFLVNNITNEKIVKLKLNITNTLVDIYINEKDLVGMPMANMRFMGTCRLQGEYYINK